MGSSRSRFWRQGRYEEINKEIFVWSKYFGKKFLETTSRCAAKIGFIPARHDNNVRIKPREDGNDHIAAHVNGISFVSKDSASRVRKIK